VSLDPTSVPDKWHVNPLNGLSRVHECETDHATEEWVAIGKIACARAIMLNNKPKYTGNNASYPACH